MKLKNAKLPITDRINRINIISITINFTLTLFLTFTRLVLKPFNHSSGNLIVISLNKLGDTIFTIPAIREIQKRFDKNVIILCFPESIPIYQLEFDDHRFCAVEHNEFYFGQRIASRSAKSKLRTLNPEIILDLTGSMISASLIYGIRAKKIVGINRKNFKSIYDHFIPVREIPQLIDIYLDAVSGLTQIRNGTEIKKNKMSLTPGGKILIHPFAGWQEKEWGLKKIIQLACLINKDFSVSLLSQNKSINSDVLNEVNYANIEVLQTESVEELIQLIKQCSLFIGNDSGPVNIANFLGKPTFTIYGATNPEYTDPKTEHQLYVQKKLNCSAQHNEKYCAIGANVYNCPGLQCMNMLTTNEVYSRLLPLLDAYCNKRTNSQIL